MKMIISILSLYIAFFSFTSCEKPPNTPCGKPNCDTTVIPPIVKLDSQILWQTPFFADTSTCLSMFPIVYSDKVIYSKYITVPGEPYIFLDKKTGSKIIELDNPKVGNSTESFYLFNNYLSICFNNQTQVVDLNAMKIIKTWNARDNDGYGQPRLGGIGKFVLTARYSTNTKEDRYTNFMVRGNIETGVLDTLFHISDSTCFEAQFGAASIFVKSTGDTLLIFDNSQYRFAGSSCSPNSQGWGRVDLYAYNLTKRKIEWKQPNVTPITGSSSVHPIIIVGDKAFYQGDKYAIMLDCITGNIVWNRFFQNEGFTQTNAVIAEGKVILKSTTSNMIALDINTGETIWENPNASHSGQNMIYHKGKVYWEGDQGGLGVIKALRVSDGVVTWTFFTPNTKKYSNANYGLCGIAIDHENDLLYTSDLRFMQCIKIPK